MATPSEVRFAPSALDSIRAIRDKKTTRELLRVCETLAQSPGSKGKPLVGELDGFRSIHAARDRYRILFQIHDAEGVVSVVFVGMRRPGEETDVYALAERILHPLADE